ncbi:MAG: hypothetical protein JO323_04810 [Acidobacteriia bacterium]|nr:hypothetical protein [Terriglobia bacterium]
MAANTQTPITLAPIRTGSSRGWLLFYPVAALLAYLQVLRAISLFESRAEAWLGFAAILLAILIPVSGLAIVGRSPLAGYLTFALPPIIGASGGLARVAMAGRAWPAPAVAIPAAVFGGGIVCSGASFKLLAKLHRSTAIALVVFVLAHLANHLFALDSLQTHKMVLDGLRVVYRNILIEPLLIAAFAIQAVLGVAMAWRDGVPGHD